MKGSSSFTLDVESGLDLGLAGDDAEGLVVHKLLEVLAELLLGILPLVVAVHLATYSLVYDTRVVALAQLVAWVLSAGGVLAHLYVAEPFVAEGAEPLVIVGGGEELSSGANARLEHDHSWHSELGDVYREGGL
jgi:hypothetical protein